MDSIMENAIRDSTANIEESESGDEAMRCVCACGALFLDSDAGVSATLAKCRECYSALLLDLTDAGVDELVHAQAGVEATIADGTNSDDSGGEQHDNITDAGTVGVASTTEQPAEDVVVADDNELTIESIESAMIMAVADSNKTFSITLNGASYEYKYYFDPINKTSSRKMFTSTFWKFPPLYWYHPYGAMNTASKTLICPLAFKTRTGEINILYSILETMCNRPRFDGLIICPETSKVRIVKNIAGSVSELLLDFPFDVDEMTRLATTYLTVHRWIYDPDRGLPRDCKNPQQADSHLKTFIKQSNDGGADTDDYAPAKPEKIAKTSKSVAKTKKEKLAPKRVSKFAKEKLPRKKAKTVVLEDGDTMSVLSTETNTSTVLAVHVPKAHRVKRTPAVVAPIYDTERENDEIDEHRDTKSLHVAQVRGASTVQYAPAYDSTLPYEGMSSKPTVSAGMVPSGMMPTGMMPTGMMSTGIMPTGMMTAEIMPAGMMPTGMMPTGMMPTGMMPTGMMPTTNGSFAMQNKFAFQSGFPSADVAGVNTSGAGIGSLLAGLMFDSIKQKAKVEALEKQREVDERALFMAQFQQVLQYNKHGSL